MSWSFDPSSLLILTFRDRNVLVYRDQCSLYENVVAIARQKFQSLNGIPAENIVLLAQITGYPVTDQVELSREIWPSVRNSVHKVTIVLEPEIRASTQGISSKSASSLPLPRSESPHLQQPPPSYESSIRTPHWHGVLPRQSSNDIQTIVVKTLTSSNPGPYEISKAGLLGKPISYIHQIIASRSGILPFTCRLIYKGIPLDDSSRTLADYNVASGDTIIMIMKSRRPIIYLFPPSSLPDVTVELLLTSSWQFSAVYPSPPTTHPFGKDQPSKRVAWAVSAEPDGTLVNKFNGAEASNLYWEAITKSHLIAPEAPWKTTPVDDVKTFDPSHPSLNPGNSVLLPTSRVAGYLDTALRSLGLHAEARTSFITCWLPDLLKHEYVALRFLPQASYEKAVRMRVFPRPDVITRVFMLFRGIAKGDLGLWNQAAARVTARDGATFWAQVVGVDTVRALDRGLFRVLEWGGMEVK